MGGNPSWAGLPSAVVELARPMNDWLQLLAFYFPLGIIGAWRWGTWLFRKLISLLYRPSRQDYEATVSVVTPVYNEDPGMFRRALESWKDNHPLEIIAVIDYTDKACIAEFEQFRQGFDRARLIVTEKPGKRPALADGIRAASGEIVALVDSDVVWGPSVREEALRPFANPKVGGVTLRQSVLEPRTLAQRIFDIQLDIRFYDDMMPVSAVSTALSCLSGRTAFYRRGVILPLVDDMVNETFWGRQCIGGEDKRLTYLLQAAGWQTRYQHEAQVFTPGARNFITLAKQRVRWSRNSWRADLRALWQGWVWRYPLFAFFLLDRVVSPFTLTLSLIYFVVSLVFQFWVPAAILVGWWLFSRTVKILPHLLRQPRDIVLAPLYVVVNFATAVIRIYSLFTLNRQDWITRWGAERAPEPGTLHLGLAKHATLVILAFLGMAVAFYNGYVAGVPASPPGQAFIALLAALATALTLIISLAVEGWTRGNNPSFGAEYGPAAGR